VSHPSQIPGPRDGEQFAGYGYGGQPIDPRTGQPVWPGYGPGGHIAGPPRKGNGLAITSLTLGIVGVLLSWIPIVGYLAFILGLLGVVFGVIGIFKSHRIMSIVGTALSVLALIFSTIAFVSFANSVDSAVDDYNAAVESAPAAPSAPTLTTPEDEARTDGGDGYPSGEVEANADADAMSDGGWQLESVKLNDSELDAMTARVTNYTGASNIAFIEVSVLLDGEYVGSASGVTDMTDHEQTDTVHLFTTDLDLDPTTDPSRISYELTAQ
jgi:hypothetical protein